MEGKVIREHQALHQNTLQCDLLHSIRWEVYITLRNEKERHVEG
jgi:hypothetical protein